MDQSNLCVKLTSVSTLDQLYINLFIEILIGAVQTVFKMKTEGMKYRVAYT